MREWIADFEERQQKEIAFAENYVANFRHGTDGHIRLLTIASMAQELDQLEKPEEVESKDPVAMGELAFKVYSENVGGLTYDDKPIPPWQELPERVRTAWIEAIKAVLG